MENKSKKTRYFGIVMIAMMIIFGTLTFFLKQSTKVDGQKAKGSEHDSTWSPDKLF